MNTDETPALTSTVPARRRGWLKTLGWVAVWLITLLVLALTLDNFLGARAWRAVREQEIASGEPTEVAQIIPPPAADAENFAAIPLFQPLLDYVQTPPTQVKPYGLAKWRDPAAKEKLEQLKAPTFRKAGNWRESEFTDLEGWQRELKAGGAEIVPGAAVVKALAAFEAPLAQVQEAAGRPRSRFPVHYEENVMAAVPHVTILMNLARAARLRALAELSMGEIDAAQRDVLLVMTLAESLREEPLLISHLVRMANWELAMQPLWEGLAARKWSDAQLASFEAALQRADIISGMQASFRGERVIFSTQALDAVKKQPSIAFVLFQPGSSPSPLWRVAGWLIPGGWIDYNKALTSRLYDDVVGTADPGAHRFYPQKLQEIHDDFISNVAHREWNPHKVLATLIFPAVISPCERYASTQVTIDLARVAIALERHRLADGAWPESLAALPEAPRDAMNGEPLHYSRNPEGGSFTLYSVGWNGRDEQGVVSWKASPPPHTVNWSEGDWVWPVYPPMPIQAK